MQQLEDLSAIIRKKDNDIGDLNDKIDDLTMQNRGLHQEIQQMKQDEAAKQAEKGAEMLAAMMNKWETVNEAL